VRLEDYPNVPNKICLSDPDHEDTQMKKLMGKHAYNAKVSEMISVNRSVNDIRHKG